MPIYETHQRLAKLILLRNRIELEIHELEREIAGRARRRLSPSARLREGTPIAGAQPKVIRQWALAQGLDVGLRGKVRDDIVQAYIEHHAHGGAHA